MLKVALVVTTVLAAPATAQAQSNWPTGTLGELPLSPGSGCLTWPAPPGMAGVCGDAPAPDVNAIPPVTAAPGSSLAVRFDEPVAELSLLSGPGTLTRVDATSWTFALAPAAVGSHLVQLTARFAGPRVTGTAAFNGHIVVASPSVSDARLRRSVARARVRVPARGTVRAHVEINGKRRSAVVRRTFSAAGERRLRLEVRRGARGKAWLVTRYTFPGAQPVEVSQRLRA